MIRGNSAQDGTPSPDAPVEIESVQSPVALTVCGANLINDTPNAAVVNRGVTFSAADGGGTKIVGTSTAAFAQSTREKYGFFRLPAGTYTAFASVDGDTGGATIAAQIFSKETNTAIKNVYMGKPTQIVLDGGLVAVFIAAYESGVTLDCVVRVMLVQSETAAPYEPYAGQSYSIPLVAADAEAYPEALELCRIGDVCDTIERRDGVWGVNKAVGKYTFPHNSRAYTIANLDTTFMIMPAPDNFASQNILCTHFQNDGITWVAKDGFCSLNIQRSPPIFRVRYAGATQAGCEALFASNDVIIIYGQLASPLWIPLSDEAQDVLDSVRLPAGVANIFATNSPAPELELTYRKTVISLPTPAAEDAGKVPVVNADGTGYELAALPSATGVSF